MDPIRTIFYTKLVYGHLPLNDPVPDIISEITVHLNNIYVGIVEGRLKNYDYNPANKQWVFVPKNTDTLNIIDYKYKDIIMQYYKVIESYNLRRTTDPGKIIQAEFPTISSHATTLIMQIITQTRNINNTHELIIEGLLHQPVYTWKPKSEARGLQINNNQVYCPCGKSMMGIIKNAQLVSDLLKLYTEHIQLPTIKSRRTPYITIIRDLLWERNDVKTINNVYSIITVVRTIKDKYPNDETLQDNLFKQADSTIGPAMIRLFKSYERFENLLLNIPSLALPSLS